MEGSNMPNGLETVVKAVSSLSIDDTDLNKYVPIIVIGDKSSGKTSILESLAGIRLQGICTRVPLVLKLQQSSCPEPKIWLEYRDKVVPTDEEHITEAICAATDAIFGTFCISPFHSVTYVLV